MLNDGEIVGCDGRTISGLFGVTGVTNPPGKSSSLGAGPGLNDESFRGEEDRQLLSV